MIKIFNPNDKNFSSNGNLVIDAYKCIETKKKSLNGWFIDVETTVDNADKLEQDMLCVVKTKSKINPQAFRIKNIKKTSTKVSFQAEHVLFDARDYFLVDVRPTNLSAVSALKYINERVDKTSPFRMDSNVNSTSTAYFINRNLLEAWTVIDERWGGVFDADNFDITFTKNVGSDKGETLTYGSNLERVEVIEDWSNVITRIYPVGPNGITPIIKYYDADISYPTNYTKKVSFESQLEDDESNTEENLLDELVENALSYLEKNKYPKVSYLVKSDVKQDLEIGDLIRVLHPLVDIETEVQEYTFDLNTRRVLTLEFGNYSRDVKKVFDSIKEDIQKAKDLASTAEYVSSRQTDLINNLNKMGLVYIDDNEILILDKLPKETAKNVWRFGLGGIGFSDSGYEGPFDFAFTMDGYLNTMFINSGSITTNHLSSDVGSSLDISSNKSIKLMTETIEDIDAEIGRVEQLTIENKGAIDITSKAVTTEVSERKKMGEDIIDDMEGRFEVSAQEIEAKISSIRNQVNLIPLLNGGGVVSDEFGDSHYPGWTFIQEGLLPGPDLNPGIDLIPSDQSSPIFEQVKVKGTLSEYSLRFGTKGVAISPAAIVVPDTVYSYRGRRMKGNQRFRIWLREYSNRDQGYDSVHTRKLLGDFNVYNQIEEASIIVSSSTYEARIEFEMFNDSELILADQMFTMGGPKEYLDSPVDVKLQAESLIKVIEDGLLLTTTQVVGIDRDIHNAGVEINAINGVTTYGKKFEVMSEDRSETYMRVTDKGIESHKLTAIDSEFSGKVTTNELEATGGKISDFDIRDGGIVGTDIGVRPNQIDIGSTTLRKASSDDYELRIEGAKLNIIPKAGHTSSIEIGGQRLASLFPQLGFYMPDVYRIAPKINEPLSAVGTPNERYGWLYLQNQPNVSSDAKIKYNFSKIDPILIDLIGKEVNPMMYNIVNDNKIHFGYLAQNVETALYKYYKLKGIEIKSFAFLNTFDRHLSLLYGELNVIIDAYNRLENQKLNSKLIDLEDRLLKLEGKK